MRSRDMHAEGIKPQIYPLLTEEGNQGMTKYRKKNNKVTTIQLTPEEMKVLLEMQRADEERRGRGRGYHTERYSIPLNSKRMPYR